MAFKASRKRGQIWEDAQNLHNAILKFPFQTTGSSENAFERGFATTLMSNREDYNQPVITQIDRNSTVRSVYCFGKNHRPDMTIGEDGIALEMKFITYAGLKDAIGQAHLYRLRYRFVFLILIISEARAQLYEEIENGQEKDLEDTLQYIANEMNIFTYIAPSFVIKSPGVRKVVPFFVQ